MHVAVVGAGAFGGWTAYHLLQQGVEVSLFDHWGPGHSRASSGGETRLIRAIYGQDAVYAKLIAEAFEQWRAFERKTGTQVYFPTGSLWLFSKKNDEYARSAIPLLAEQGLTVEEWTLAQVKAQYPQVNLADIHSAFWEKEAGYLMARKACQEVLATFVHEGGQYRREKALPGKIERGRLQELKLAAGETVQADAYVFACGPWMPRLFPDLLGSLITVSRQEIHYFGLPERGDAFNVSSFPIWVDMGERVMYGVADYDGRGFKLADDTREGAFDPTTADRQIREDKLDQVRTYLDHRFPSLKGAPMTEARVCQYSNSPTGHFLIDQHPEAENLFLLGAGCGHGFKLGPCVGQLMANRINQGIAVPEEFRLSTHQNAGKLTNQFEH